MSDYLLNIAARGEANDMKGLMPATHSFFSAVDAGIVEDFATENNIPDSAAQNQFVQQSILPDQPSPLQKAQPAVVLDRTELKKEEKNTETSYFSKHVERVEAKEENSTLKTNIAETVSFKIEPPTPKKDVDVVENTALKPYENEPNFDGKIASKIIPEKKETKKKSGEKRTDDVSETDTFSKPSHSDEKRIVVKQKINPAFDDEDRKKNNLLPATIPAERIIPKQPNQVNKLSVQNNMLKEAAAKLVIGKIIVEILPPKLSAPQKIITKVVQSPSNDSYTKSNKLIFGLGQL